jgi:hypothetical protein
MLYVLMVVIRYFMKDRGEPTFQDQTRGSCTIYTNSDLPEDIKPYVQSCVVISFDGNRIAGDCKKLACTDCQPMPSLGIGVTYL